MSLRDPLLARCGTRSASARWCTTSSPPPARGCPRTTRRTSAPAWPAGIRRRRGREELVDEMAGAAAAGLVRAHAMLAAALVPRNAALSALAAEARPDPDAVRRELLAAVGGRTQWVPPPEPSPSAQPTRPAP